MRNLERAPQVTVMQVIEVHWVAGRGVDESDPARPVRSYFTMEGEFLAERDQWQEQRKARG